MFKGASQHMQRMAVKTNKKVDQARKLHKLGKIAEGQSSKAVRGKIKNMEEGQAARMAKRRARAEKDQSKRDPVAAEKRAQKLAAKRMRNVAIVVKKKS